MKHSKVLCLILMLAVVFSLTSCVVWEKLPFAKKYTVEFDSNGGSAVEAQTVAKGKLALKPEDPAKEGYTFLGWFNGEEEWNFETPITDNLTLVAHWQEVQTGGNECTSHVDENNDSKCDNCGETILVTYRIKYFDGTRRLSLAPSSFNSNTKDLVLPDAPEKAHYIFIGWYAEPELTNKVDSIDVNNVGDISLYAKYDTIEYNVTYYLDEGTNAETNPSTYNIESLITELADPTREGYNFKGWYTDANCTTAFEAITKETVGDLVLYAKWELKPITYTITYLDHEDNKLADVTYYLSNSDQLLMSVTDFPEYVLPEGCTFLHWVDTNGLICYNIPANTKDGIVVKANITNKPAEEIYTLACYVDMKDDENSYIKDRIVSVSFVKGEKVPNLPTLTLAGYEFNGWYDNDKMTGDKITCIDENAAVSDENEVFIFASQTPIDYTVKYFDFDTKEEYKNFEPNSYHISAEEIKLPDVPEKEGYIAKGWYTADGVKVTSIAPGSIGNLELYACYDPKTYTITYYLYGGENDERNVTEYQHDIFPTLYDPLARDGYLFQGWYTDATFNSTFIEGIEDYANMDIILYAKWVPITDNNGSSTMTPEVPF